MCIVTKNPTRCGGYAGRGCLLCPPVIINPNISLDLALCKVQKYVDTLQMKLHWVGSEEAVKLIYHPRPPALHNNRIWLKGLARGRKNLAKPVTFRQF